MNLKPNILKPLASFITCILLITSCGSDKKSGEKEEGVIEFETKAIDQTHPLSGLAPGSATLKFKKEKFIIEMSTMGMFNTSIIGDLEKKTIAQTVKFMDIKQASIDNEVDILKENSLYKLKIEETKETKVIASLKCIKLKVTMIDNPSVTFDAYYTKDLGMENCNELTPYAGVKGVLMDYRVKRMGLEMRFLAKSYNNIEIADDLFIIPTNMKMVTKAEMSKFFDDLQ